MDFKQKAKEIAEQVANLAKEKNKLSIFSFASTAHVDNPEIIFPSVRETQSTVAANVIIRKYEIAQEIVQLIDGLVDIILIDVESKTGNVNNLDVLLRPLIKKSRVETFKPNDFTVEACDAIIAKIASPIFNKKITIIGAGNIGGKLSIKLAERGAKVTITRPDIENLKKLADGINVIIEKYANKVNYNDNNLQASKNADILIGFTPGIPVINEEIISVTSENAIIIDGGIGTIEKTALPKLLESNRCAFCLDMRAGYAGSITTILETNNFVNNIMGKKIVETPKGSIHLVAGGIIGNKNDVVVDNIKNPKRIIGAANGTGDLLLSSDISEDVKEKIAVFKKEIGE